MAICPKCGSQNPDGYSFCVSCGTPNSASARPQQVNQQPVNPQQINPRPVNQQPQQNQSFEKSNRICPSCGLQIPGYEMRCPGCGFELQESRTNPTVLAFANKINACEQQVAMSPAPKKTGYSSWSTTQVVWWWIFNVVFFFIPWIVYFAAKNTQYMEKKNLNPAEKTLLAAIENQTFPNDRETLLSALVYIKGKVSFLSSDASDQNTFWTIVWATKGKQVHSTFKSLYGNDNTANEAFREINTTYETIKATYRKRMSIFIILAVVCSLLFLFLGSGGDDGEKSLTWPSEGIATELPTIHNAKGNIKKSTSDSFYVVIRDFSEGNYNEYLSSVEEMGFTGGETTITNTHRYTYTAENEEGHDLKITYNNNTEKMVIELTD